MVKFLNMFCNLLSTPNRDYVVYNSSLIVNNDETEGSQSKGVSEGWRADHQNIDTIQAFKEMISQRLAQVWFVLQ